MSSWLISLILSAIITLLLILLDNDNQRDKKTYGIKVYVVSFLSIYFGLMFLGDNEIKHEINTGEPPF